MGMFDYIKYECVCPVCHNKLDDFQSKDFDCELKRISPLEVRNFYTWCAKCGCETTFYRYTYLTDIFLRETLDKQGQVMEQYSKRVIVKEG